MKQIAKIHFNSLFDQTSIWQKAVFILMSITVFFNPFPHVTAIKEIGLYMSVLIIAAMTISGRMTLRFKQPFLISFFLFFVWACIGLLFALDKSNSLKDLYAHLIKYFIMFYVIINVYDTLKKLEVLSWLIIVSGTAFSIGGLIYEYVIMQKSLSDRFGEMSLAQTPTNLLVVTLMFGIMLCIYYLHAYKSPYGKIIALSCMIPMAGVTLLTQTRANILALIAAFIVFYIDKKKTMATIMIGIVLLIVFSPIRERFSDADNTIKNPRVGISLIALEIIKDYPIFGTGFCISTYGNSKYIDPEYYKARIKDRYDLKEELQDPHNIYLSIAVRMGIIGLVLFFYIIYAVTKTALRNIKTDRLYGLSLLSIFVMFLVKSAFEPMFTHMVEVSFCVLLAMICVSFQCNQSTSEA